MQRNSKIFVFLVFGILCLSFWATTASLYLEFSATQGATSINDSLWLKLLTHYSDLFIFFPLFGTVALIAFYRPACVFVDMYWYTKGLHGDAIPRSRARFVIWFLCLTLLSFIISVAIQSSSERSLWQLKPEILTSDTGEGCSGNECATRVSFIDGLNNMRQLSRARLTVTDLAPQCRPDRFIEPQEGMTRTKRYCAAMTTFTNQGDDLKGRLVDDSTCCRAQLAFDQAVKKAHENTQNRSITHKLQEHTWPFNIFFLLTLMVLSILLAFRRGRIEKEYSHSARSIDRGVIIGVLAVAFLVIMNRSFLEVTNLLHGSGGAASVHRGLDTFIVLFAIWALLILLSFVNVSNKQAELISRSLSVIFSVLFVLNSNTITDYGIRFLGAGADLWTLGAALIIALAMIAALHLLKHVSILSDDNGEKPSEKNKAEQA